jgi:hypothetical protein
MLLAGNLVGMGVITAYVWGISYLDFVAITCKWARPIITSMMFLESACSSSVLNTVLYGLVYCTKGPTGTL